MAKSYSIASAQTFPKCCSLGGLSNLDEFIIDQQDLRRNNCSADLSGKQIISYYSNIYSLHSKELKIYLEL
jgi:hypothetical protein